MRPLSIMLIAGDPSGDQLAAELVAELRTQLLRGIEDRTSDVQPLRTELAPRFFGAGGPKMAAAGVELAFDLTQHAIIGFAEALKNIAKFRRLFRQLLRMAIERQPDVIIGVDYGGFNLRFGKAIKDYVRRHRSEFVPWDPKIVQFVSPQVWASRPARALTLADNYDLLLSIFPFEKAWYAQRVPSLRVEFVGHPMIGRNAECGMRNAEQGPQIVLLAGSRADEVRRHLPIIAGAFALLRKAIPGARGRMVLPSNSSAEQLKAIQLHLASQALAPAAVAEACDVAIQKGGLSEALANADLAITKSGTVTMECAQHGVPAVVFYKTSWPTYIIGKQIITVKYIAMPNLLAQEAVYPEFIQHEATPENISRAALELLRDESRRTAVKVKLAKVIASLGEPGAARRAAKAIAGLLQ